MYLLDNYQAILIGAASIIGAASVLVAAISAVTKNKKDDKVAAAFVKVADFLKKISLNVK